MYEVHPEMYALWLGLGCYRFQRHAFWQGVIRLQCRESAVLGALARASCFVALAIAQRWVRLGHGPFFNMFEILASNLFSLGLVYVIAYWQAPTHSSERANCLADSAHHGIVALSQLSQGQPFSSDICHAAALVSCAAG